MSPSPARPSRLGMGEGYRRTTTLDVLDDLTNPGTSGDSGDDDRASPIAVTSVPSDTSGTSGTSVTPGTKTPEKPVLLREQVKVAGPLVGEMRDAVWFLTEHGRPRVKLGELLDEAVKTWLESAKAEHNGGEAFPVRGRLR